MIKWKLINKLSEEIYYNSLMELCFSLKDQCYFLQLFCIMNWNEQAGVKEIILLHMCLCIDDGGFWVSSSWLAAVAFSADRKWKLSMNPVIARWTSVALDRV